MLAEIAWEMIAFVLAMFVLPVIIAVVWYFLTNPLDRWW